MDGRNYEGMTLYDMSGRRKYLTFREGRRFHKFSEKADKATSLFCQIIYYTGCRISEALELTPQQLDAGEVCIIFRTLKRRKPHFRAVPVPASLMRELVAYTWVMARDEPIWKWCRQTAWRHVKTVLGEAGIVGAHANPKGLRHGFGIANAQENIPAGLTRSWMGHARLETTAIYQQPVGKEERRFAMRLWRDHRNL